MPLNSCHLVTLFYLLILYVIYASYKCTCSRHQTTQFFLPPYWMYPLCANTLSQLNMRIWPSRNFNVGDRGMAEIFLVELMVSYSLKQRNKVSFMVVDNHQLNADTVECKRVPVPERWWLATAMKLTLFICFRHSKTQPSHSLYWIYWFVGWGPGLVSKTVCRSRAAFEHIWQIRLYKNVKPTATTVEGWEIIGLY